MVEIIESIGLVILGALLTLVTTWILERIKFRKHKQVALLMLDQIISEVEYSIGHGHNFKHKGDWQKELDDLAKADRSWLGDLYLPIKRISWMIRDHTFDHGKDDASEYCCDELLADLHILQLAISVHPPRKKQINEKEKAKQLAESILIDTSGVILSSKVEELTEGFLNEWKEGKLDTGRLAKSSVWHTRKRS